MLFGGVIDLTNSPDFQKYRLEKGLVSRDEYYKWSALYNGDYIYRRPPLSESKQDKLENEIEEIKKEKIEFNNKVDIDCYFSSNNYYFGSNYILKCYRFFNQFDIDSHGI